MTIDSIESCAPDSSDVVRSFDNVKLHKEGKVTHIDLDTYIPRTIQRITKV